MRDALRDAEILRVTKGVRNEVRALVNATIATREAEDRARIEARLEQDRARVEARIAQAKARAKPASLRPRKGSPRPSPTSSKTVSQHRDPVTCGGSIRLSASAPRLTSLAGSSWHSKAMSADSGLALKSRGSPAAQLASISRATFSWRQATAISTWITQRTAWFTTPRNPDSSRELA